MNSMDVIIGVTYSRNEELGGGCQDNNVKYGASVITTHNLSEKNIIPLKSEMPFRADYLLDGFVGKH